VTFLVPNDVEGGEAEIKKPRIAGLFKINRMID